MNYGKDNAAKQAKKLSDSSHKHKKNFWISLLKFTLIAMVSVILGGCIFAYMFAKDLIADLPDARTIDITPTGYLSTVYDKDGNEIETLAASGANRTFVTLDQIPLDMQHAFVAIEDERFYDHNGIDMKGIIRAAYTGVANGFHFSQGASTITQQLLKNNYFSTWTSEKTFRDKLNRKIQEQYLAVQIEKVVSKDYILENYLNSINLGQNTLGVEAASERYFNKSVSELTLSESACIAAITQNPSQYNPITHPEDNEKRRKKVLTNMLNQGWINETEYDVALNDDVYDRIQTVNNEVSTASTTFFVDALTDEVVNDLINELGYSESEAYRLLYSGGLDIYSTQDTAIQEILDTEINNPDNYSTAKISFSYRLTVNKADGTTKNYSEITMLSFYQAKNKNYSINFKDEDAALEAIEGYKADIMEEGDTIPEGGETLSFTMQPQAAMTIMDQSTGAVVALTGGRGEKKASKTLNRATGITRQPGSTFKIIAAYCAALDAGGMTLATVENDTPMNYADNKTPLSNYDKYYRGWTNLRTAITSSINVVTVRTLTDVGTSLGFQYVQSMGITTLIDGDNNQSLALGGITNGVTNLELTGAYATIANHGKYNKPIFYTQVLDHSGNVILDNTQNTSTQILKETTAYLLTNAMQDVMTKGTGTKANFSGVAVAGKSGTTTKERDTVFAGFTPYYTAVIWGGFDDNSPQTLTGTGYSKLIWRKVMSQIHADLPYKDFERPEGIVEVAVCAKSGKLPVEGVCDCDPTGSKVYTELFAEGTEPTEYCDKHFVGLRCNDTGLVANTGCWNTSWGIWIMDAGQNCDDGWYGIILNGRSDVHCDIHGGDHTAEPGYVPTKDFTFVPIGEDNSEYIDMNQ